ncbi:MAG TPA: DUF4157 domain-containing protein, partial [Polyangiaceae bacterium]|nr:DUF4157 domain-containing protein [Polyangiaceae bacterium]
AELVFGDSIDLDEVHLSFESTANDIIFGVQDFFTQLFSGNFSSLTDEIDSRAFVTGNLINFDTSDNNFNRPTLIHELTHVWQNQHVGPVYLAHAVVGQIVEGYNYGYDEPSVDIEVPGANFDGTNITQQRGFIRGDGGEAELLAAGGDLDEFNPERQGQIIMHWFVRSQLFSGTVDFTPWQPYVDQVRLGMPERALAA